MPPLCPLHPPPPPSLPPYRCHPERASCNTGRHRYPSRLQRAVLLPRAHVKERPQGPRFPAAVLIRCWERMKKKVMAVISALLWLVVFSPRSAKGPRKVKRERWVGVGDAGIRETTWTPSERNTRTLSE